MLDLGFWNYSENLGRTLWDIGERWYSHSWEDFTSIGNTSVGSHKAETEPVVLSYETSSRETITEIWLSTQVPTCPYFFAALFIIFKIWNWYSLWGFGLVHILCQLKNGKAEKNLKFNRQQQRNSIYHKKNLSTVEERHLLWLRKHKHADTQIQKTQSWEWEVWGWECVDGGCYSFLAAQTNWK